MFPKRMLLIVALAIGIALIPAFAGNANAPDNSTSTSNANYSNSTYRSEIRRLYEKDQAIEMGAYNSASERDKIMEQFTRSTNKKLKNLISQYGWPTYSLVGQAASDAAFVLILHQDSDPAFQRYALNATLPFVKEGQMSAYWHAYLYDRVLHHLGKKQLYGTQGRCVSTGPEGEWQPFPINGEKTLDQRRREVGMKPESEYINELSKVTCRNFTHFSPQ